MSDIPGCIICFEIFRKFSPDDIESLLKSAVKIYVFKTLKRPCSLSIQTSNRPVNFFNTYGMSDKCIL